MYFTVFSHKILDVRGYRVAIVIVGNKSDVEESQRQIARDEAESIVTEEWGCGYVECSAKENSGIVEVFKELLVQAKIRYNLSPAVRRRRQSLPSYSLQGGNSKLQPNKYSLKRHSCTVS